MYDIVRSSFFCCFDWSRSLQFMILHPVVVVSMYFGARTLQVLVLCSSSGHRRYMVCTPTVHDWESIIYFLFFPSSCRPTAGTDDRRARAREWQKTKNVLLKRHTSNIFLYIPSYSITEMSSNLYGMVDIFYIINIQLISQNVPPSLVPLSSSHQPQPISKPMSNVITTIIEKIRLIGAWLKLLNSISTCLVEALKLLSADSFIHWSKEFQSFHRFKSVMKSYANFLLNISFVAAFAPPHSHIHNQNQQYTSKLKSTIKNDSLPEGPTFLKHYLE